MTTVVEPETPVRRPRGMRLLLVTAALIMSVVLIILGSSALRRDDSSAGTAAMSDGANSSYIATASVELGTSTTEAAQFYRDLTLDNVVSLGVPFLRYNRYYTRFFLKEGETVEIFMEANLPLGASLVDGNEGLSVLLIPGGAPYERSHAHAYLPPTEKEDGGYFRRLERAGGNWTVGWAITALSSDYYWLVLTNTARQSAWCHFTVNVPSD